MTNIVSVIGDIVLDCHLYGGVKTAATSFSEPGTVYTEEEGGAVLSSKLLAWAADAKGLTLDARSAEWEESNQSRKAKGQMPLPWDGGKRPAPEYKCRLDMDIRRIRKSIPKHLRSYGVWVDRPACKDSKDRVWRVDRHFGYGPVADGDTRFQLGRNPGAPAGPPTLTLIDDGGILFRHRVSRRAWPDFAQKTKTWYLLKMSWPLCRCDLWAELTPAMDRLIVLIGADDLRREDAQINSRLSWEQCAEHTIAAFRDNTVAAELLRAAHVIVTYRSAGALWVERLSNGEHVFRLLFDPERLEGDFDRAFEGTTYGFQTVMATAIAHHLMSQWARPRDKRSRGASVAGEALEKGIAAGLRAGLQGRRRLLECGHGRIENKDPGFPFAEVGEAIAGTPGGYVLVQVPTAKTTGCPWTILAQSEGSGTPATPSTPLFGLAHMAARYGPAALSWVPCLSVGQLFSVDRSEIESLRMLSDLICRYEAEKVQKKPLSIGVFGPPGAGKSFGVKALAEALLGKKAPLLEFNLSQFKDPSELIGAFHRVRDEVLKGTTPVAFWDEFDSQHYRWLQYLLAPMQDGAFQQGEITHPIGKSIFIFAGGTSSTMDDFGVQEPEEPSADQLAGMSPEGINERRREYERQNERYQEFKLLKGPDFISRLHGFLNVLGPNSQAPTGCVDQAWPIRRALMLRGNLGMQDSRELDIDSGLLNALLGVPKYNHGARSLAKITSALIPAQNGRLQRSALPPSPLLQRETNATEFHRLLLHGNTLRNHPDIERLAAAVNFHYLQGAEKSRVEAETKGTPEVAWNIHRSVRKEYDSLDTDKKASNRAAARRIPDLLLLIGYEVVPNDNGDKSWQTPLNNAISQHVDRLAQAEHLGWCAERKENGWTYNKTRNDALKHHPTLVRWAKLSPSDQEKDRNSARSIPKILEIARMKAVPCAARSSV